MYSRTVHLYCTVIQYTCTVQSYCTVVLYSHTVHLYYTVIQYTCTVHLYCTVVLYSHTVHLYCTVILYTCTVQSYCTLVLYSRTFWPLEAEIACLCTRWPVVTMVTSVSYEIDQKRKLVRTLGFFLDFSSQLILTTGSWDSLPVCLVTSGDHGDHGTSVSVGQWAYSDVSLNLTLCQWLTFWREICVTSLRKVCWWVVGGGIAIIESAPGPDLEIWDGDGYEMTWTWPGHDLDMDMVWTRAWQFQNRF